MSVAEFLYTVVLRPPRLRSLANSTIRALLPKTIQRHGATICLNPRDPVVSGALAFSVYEKAETQFLLKVFRPGMTFVDVGANIGYYTALASVAMKGEGRIVSLEPDPENFEFLQKTIAANRATNVTPVRKAAAEKPGMMKLFTSSNNRGDNRLYANELADGSCEVEIITIDQLLEELNIPQIHLLKIDVQGFEGHVFDGMRKAIAQSPELIILSEFWPQGLRSAGTDPVELLERLEGFGLRLRELTSQGELRRFESKTKLVAQFPGRKYTNIVAMRGQSTTA